MKEIDKLKKRIKYLENLLGIDCNGEWSKSGEDWIVDGIPVLKGSDVFHFEWNIVFCPGTKEKLINKNSLDNFVEAMRQEMEARFYYSVYEDLMKKNKLPKELQDSLEFLYLGNDTPLNYRK